MPPAWPVQSARDCRHALHDRPRKLRFRQSAQARAREPAGGSRGRERFRPDRTAVLLPPARPACSSRGLKSARQRETSSSIATPLKLRVVRYKCGGSEVRNILAASPNCGLLNLSHTRIKELLVSFDSE